MSTTSTVELDQANSQRYHNLRSRSRSGSRQPVPIRAIREVREEIRLGQHDHISEGQTVDSHASIWPTEYRRVPAYRRVALDLDRCERPSGSNGVEHLVIAVMMRGVKLQSVSMPCASSSTMPAETPNDRILLSYGKQQATHSGRD
jgi:hypothetical protein